MFSRKDCALILCVLLCAFVPTPFANGAKVRAMNIIKPVPKPKPKQETASVLLRFKYTSGEILKYHQVIINDIETGLADGSSEPQRGRIKEDVYLVQETKSVLENGDARIWAAVESATLTTTEEPDPKEVDKNKVYTFIMSKTGAISDKKVVNRSGEPYTGEGAQDDAAMWLSVPFSDKPVKVGDTWECDLAGPYATPAHVKSTLMKVDGDDAVIRSEWSIDLDGTSEDIGTCTASCTVHFSLNAARVTKFEMDQVSKMIADQPIGDGTTLKMKASATYHVTAELLPQGK